MSSSRKNPNTTRAYRERAQPEGRQRLGLLEKRKDYKLRAADHNEKKRKLRALQQKASERNADEFYFGMMGAKTDNKSGRKQLEDGGRGNKALSQDVVRLLKTQDAGYLRTALQQARRERERLEQEILVMENEDGSRLQALRDQPAQSGQVSDDSDADSDEGFQEARHTVFVDDLEQQQDFDAQAWFETDANGLEQAYNRPRRQHESAHPESFSNDPQKQSTPKLSVETEKQAWKEKRRQQKRKALTNQQRLARLAAVKDREKSLIQAERELDLQRAKMSNTAGGVNKKGIKFKQRERKK